jgi:hypothetical protein
MVSDHEKRGMGFEPMDTRAAAERVNRFAIRACLRGSQDRNLAIRARLKEISRLFKNLVELKTKGNNLAKSR